jgi:hypothetical protein
MAFIEVQLFQEYLCLGCYHHDGTNKLSGLGEM